MGRSTQGGGPGFLGPSSQDLVGELDQIRIRVELEAFELVTKGLALGRRERGERQLGQRQEQGAGGLARCHKRVEDRGQRGGAREDEALGNAEEQFRVMFALATTNKPGRPLLSLIGPPLFQRALHTRGGVGAHGPAQALKARLVLLWCDVREHESCVRWQRRANLTEEVLEGTRGRGPLPTEAGDHRQERALAFEQREASGCSQHNGRSTINPEKGDLDALAEQGHGGLGWGAPAVAKRSGFCPEREGSDGLLPLCQSLEGALEQEEITLRVGRNREVSLAESVERSGGAP
jgi:hypothetical protein